MGIIQSIFYSVTFCIERTLTWACCAILLICIMFFLLVMMTYGISIGYHFAQKELAAFAAESRTTTTPPSNRRAADRRSVVRLVAVNRTSEGRAQPPLLDNARTSPKEVFLEPTLTPVIILETERSPGQTELSPDEKDVAQKLLDRLRRSRTFGIHNVKDNTNLFRFPIPIQ